ncbi:MAG: hypothetical protein ACRDP6_47360 [Actinoallomurus sp.]
MTTVGLGKSLQAWRSGEHLCDCGRPAPHATICGSCRDALHLDLSDLVLDRQEADRKNPVPSLITDLDTVLTRQTRYQERAGGRSSTRPLPFDERASDALWALGDTLRAWARAVNWGDPSIRGCGQNLLDHLNELATHPDAAQAVDELTAIVDQIRRVCDRPPVHMYLGPCGCGTDLYTRQGSIIARCRECDLEYQVAERREWLLATAEDRLATATDIALAMPTLLGRELSASTVRNWAADGRLAAHGHDPHNRPLYRIGEVIQLALATPTRRRTRVA